MKMKKSKKIQLENYLLSSVLLGLGLILTFTILHTRSSMAQVDKQPLLPAIQNTAQEKYAEPTTLIQTDSPNSVVSEVKKRGISVKEVTQARGTSSIVEIDASASDAAVRSMKAKLPPGTKIAPNQRYQATSHLTPNDTQYGDQWNLAKIEAPAAWDITTGSSSTVLAIIDSGILFSQTVDGTTYAQPDFTADKAWINQGEAGALASNGIDDDGNGFVDDWRGWDFMGGYSGDADCPNNVPGEAASTFFNSDNDPQPYSCDSPTYPTELNKTHYNDTCVAFESACYVGHGTIVGSVAGAKTNNNTYIAGVDHNVSLMNVRVLDGYGFTDTNIVTQAVRYATTNGADVINLSLATSSCDGSSSDPILEDALADAAAAGVIVVAASGNGGINSVCYPASSPYTIAVGATTQSDQKASFSNAGSSLDIVAPGVGIPAANAPSNATPAHYYPSANGTSLATPHVAGAVAGLKSLNSDISLDSATQILRESNDKLAQMSGANRTDEHGYGRLNISKAYSMLANGAYGDIRLIKCSEQEYLVERNIRKKRLVNSTAMEHWKLDELNFRLDDPGCAYPTYEVALDRVVRSRTTGREYLTDQGSAKLIHSREAADSWGLGNYTSNTYPQLNGASIHFLQVERNLPDFTPSLSGANIRLFKCAEQEYLVERGIQRSRLITSSALERWKLDNAYFAPEDNGRGCSYPTYSVPLESVIRSRTTGKEYLVMGAKAYYIHSQEAADSWNLGDYSNTTYPQFNGKSIHYLEVVRELPMNS